MGNYRLLGLEKQLLPKVCLIQLITTEA